MSRPQDRVGPATRWPRRRRRFSRFDGMRQAMRALIETETGARVLIMSNGHGSAW